MAEVLKFTGNTTLPEDPAVVLEDAKAWGLTRMMVCGWDDQGKFIFGGSHCEVGELLILVEMVKRRLMDQVDG